MDETVQNQMMYCILWQMVNKLAETEEFDKRILDTLNRKNAETLDCDVLPLKIA